MIVLERYVADFADHPGWVALAGLLFAVTLATLLLRRPLPRLPWRPVYWLTLAAIGAAGVAWALHLGWIADDAFISFRYSRNWAAGQGLVYNPGERVEGYTNFLWVALLTPFEWFGWHLALPSTVLTLTFLVLTLVLVARLGVRHGPRSAPPYLSVAAALLAFNYVFASYATSGLETMMGAFWVLFALDCADRERPYIAGLAGILATMTHPDHAIFYVALASTYLIDGRLPWTERLARLARYAAAFAAVYVPYFAWRWHYYGDFFPNTFYTKSASQLYFLQGFRFLGISGLSAGLWATLPAAALGMWVHRSRRLARFTALSVPLFLLYVAKIGGDFMLGRLLCPLLPPVFAMAELGIRWLWTKPGLAVRFASAVLLALACTAAVPTPIARPYEKFLHVADERTFYTVSSYGSLSMKNVYWRRALALNKALPKLSRPPVLALGSLGIIGYETDVPIVDNYGLVNRELAHWRLRKRGRPGHEKMMSPGQVVHTSADLSDLSVFPEPYHEHGRTRLKDMSLHVVRYERDYFEELVRAGFRRPRLPRYIDRYRPPRGPDREARLACDLWYMNQIYFRHQRDEGRRRRITGRVERAFPELRGLVGLLLDAPEAPRGFAAVQHLDFDEASPAWSVQGDAFEGSPRHRESVGQRIMAGVRGGFLNSYRDLGADAATGTLTTEEIPIVGDALTLQVGGGNKKDVYVELLVDGQPWFSATGCNSPILGRRVWNTSQLKGATARLRLVDHSKSGWGHLVVDDLVQWSIQASAAAPRPNGPR